MVLDLVFDGARSGLSFVLTFVIAYNEYDITYISIAHHKLNWTCSVLSAKILNTPTKIYF